MFSASMTNDSLPYLNDHDTQGKRLVAASTSVSSLDDLNHDAIKKAKGSERH